jgi:hypothetical protein
MKGGSCVGGVVVTCSNLLSYQLTVTAVKNQKIHVTVDCFQKYFIPEDFTFPGKSSKYVFGILVDVKVLHFDCFIRG